ncbi:MAG: hypothetical protein FDZ75_00260, partial [Actinobacteria bacterium]
AEGTTTISYRSVDYFNNYEDAKSVDVLVDNSTPITTSDAIASYTDQAVLTLSPNDPYSGVAYTKYRIDGSAWTTGTVATVNWSRWRRYHTVDWYSVDNVGNVEANKSATFEVKLTSNVYNSSDSKIIYRDNWYSAYSGDVRETNTSGDYALLSFQGTRFDLMSRMGPGMGKMRVTVLDTTMTPVIVDLYDNNERDGNANYPVFSTGDIDFGDYNVKIDFLGSKNALSTGTRINLDEVRIDGSLVQVADTLAPVTVFSGPASWAEGPVTLALSATDATSGVKAIYATSNGTTPTVAATYTAPFVINTEGSTVIKYYAVDMRGNTESVKGCVVRVDNSAPVTNSNVLASYPGTASVALLPNDPNSGVAYTKYRVDGGTWVTGTGATIAASQLGTHKIDWYSVDNLGHVEATKSASFYITNRYDQEDPRISLRGSWTYYPDTNMHAGGYRRALSPGSTTDISFYGTRLDWIAPMANNYGQATVILDGTPVGIVDLYRSTFANKQVVWSSGWLANGFHHVKFEPTGTKNASSGGTQVMFDACDVVGTLTQADIVAPTTSDNAPTTWVNSDATVTLVSSDATAGVSATFVALDGSAISTYSAPVIVAGEGVHTLSYYSVDKAGNRETTRTATVRIDKTAPVTGDNIPTTWRSAPTTVSLSAVEALSGSAVTYYSVDDAPASAYTGPFQIAADGVHTIAYRTVDNAGNAETTKTATLRIDKTAPVTGDNAPTKWVAGSWSLTLAPVDLTSGVESVRFSINGAAAATYTAAIPVTANGTTTVAYSAVDAAGNREATKTATVLVDALAPVTANTAPTSWVKGPVSVGLTAIDAHSGVIGTGFRINGGTVSTYTAPITVSAEGTTTIEYWTTDAVGNRETTKTATVRIDNTAPVTASDAATRYADVATITLSPSDTRSGVSTTKYRFDGGGWQSGAKAVVSTSGTHTVEFLSIDAAGNQEATRSATFVLYKRIEQTSDRVSYIGSWGTYTDSLMTSSTAAYTFRAGSGINFTFDGTRFEWIGNKGTSYGKATVTVDGGTPVTLDLYSSGFKYRQVLFSTGDIASGRHNVHIEVEGSKNASSTSTYVYTDAFDVVGDAS